MKTFFLLLLLSQYLAAQVAENNVPILPSGTDSTAIYDKLLKPSAMKEDLRLFRDIREKTNSGLYRYRTKKQIDSIYHWAFTQIKKPLRITSFYKIILQLTDFEGSVHNYTEADSDLVNYFNRQKAFFPFSLKYIDGKIIFNNSSQQIPPGSRILAINGVSDSSLMHSFYKYFPADGYSITEKLSASVNRSFGIRYLLEYGLSKNFEIIYTLPHHSAKKTVTVPAVYLEERMKNWEARHSFPVDSRLDFTLRPSHSFQMINDSTGLLDFRVFSMASGKDDPAFDVYVRFIDSVFKALDKNSVQHLIIDIRNNPGGSDPTYEEPMMHLTDKPFKENTSAYIIFDQVPYEKYFWGISTSAKMSAEEIKAGKDFLKDYFPVFANGRSLQDPKHNPVYYPKLPQYRGKVYLLIDENVASAASHFASLVKAYATNATIVGVETVGGYYGHNGHMPVVYELPHSKIKTKFSIVYVVQDAPLKPDQPEGRGIMPDYEVWQGFEDFLLQRDTQMEFVMRLISSEHKH